MNREHQDSMELYYNEFTKGLEVGDQHAYVLVMLHVTDKDYGTRMTSKDLCV